MEWPKLNQYLH